MAQKATGTKESSVPPSPSDEMAIILQFEDGVITISCRIWMAQKAIGTKESSVPPSPSDEMAIILQFEKGMLH